MMNVHDQGLQLKAKRGKRDWVMNQKLVVETRDILRKTLELLHLDLTMPFMAIDYNGKNKTKTIIVS